MGDEEPQVSNLTVTGGAGGAAANLDDLLTLAGLHRNLAADLDGLAGQVAGIASDADLIQAAVFDPAGVIAVNGMITDALNGRLGLYRLSGQLADHAEQVQQVHDYTVRSDETQSALMDGVNWFLGASNLTVPLAVGEYFGTSIREEFTGGPGFSLGVDWILAHPGYLDRYGPQLPGLLKMPGWLNFQEAAGLIAGQWPDGTPRLLEDDDPDKTLFVRHAPTGLGGLMTNLETRNQENKSDDDEIDVQEIHRADGTTAYIVNIPGTKNLNPGLPGQSSSHPNDMVTNLYGVAGEQTAREEAIAMALEAAGASSTDPVMLVGHSQGGIVAAQAAADTANGSFDFNVTHVVTAASPVALAEVPSDVQVLSLEGNNDLIPQSDAAPNPDAANRTTVHFDYDTGDMGRNHGLGGSYQEAADILDAQLNTPASGLGGAVSGTGSSASPSVSAFMDSASAFFDDGSGNTLVETHVYDIERVPR